VVHTLPSPILIAFTACATLCGGCVYDRTGRSGTSMIVRDVQSNQVNLERVRGEVGAERARIDEMDNRASLARRNIAKSNATAENLVESVQALAGELQNIRHEIENARTFDNDLDYRLADLAFRLMAIEEELGIEPEVYEPVEEDPPEDAADGGDAEPVEGDPEDGGEQPPSGDGADATTAPAAGEEFDAMAAVAIPVDESLGIEEAIDDSEGGDPDLNLLARALQAMQTEKFAQAGRALSEFLDDNPEHERAADARALLGDCLFEMGRYTDAISEYEAFIQTWPAHARVPAAMLSQGLAFIELGGESDLGAARVFLDDLIERYPDSPEAAKARRKIQILE
jgi:tol-pal system protein YbgF